jgi:hypothetical protein
MPRIDWDSMTPEEALTLMKRQALDRSRRQAKKLSQQRTAVKLAKYTPDQLLGIFKLMCEAQGGNWDAMEDHMACTVAMLMPSEN